MDIWDEENHVFNIRLAKLTGLYQILDPRTIKFRGQNVYHIVLAIIMLYLCVISMILIISSLYYWPSSASASVDYCWNGVYAEFLIFKMWNIVYYSNDVWNCLTITRYDFTSHSLRNRHILDRWRERSVRITTMMTGMYLTSLVFFMGSSLAIRHDIMMIKNHDGSVSNYRQNLINLYLIVTDETYNAHYKTFYIVEAFFIVSTTILFLVFDVLLVTLCLATSCQMQMVNAAFESIGNKWLCDPNVPIIDSTNESTNVSNKNDLIYDELISSTIMDHQAVMKKYNELLALFKRVMLLQVISSSLSFTIIWICIIMSFSGEDRFMASDVTTLKMICIMPSFLFQIFVVCALFDNLHNQKDSITFALYCSNWTEMNMKNKKLVLSTMKMNNANQNKLKFTRTKIVNLELFLKVMSNCYTIVSVLFHYLKAKYK